MSKYPPLKTPVFVTGCSTVNSRYGGEIHQLSFRDIVTGDDYSTWIDPQNANWSTWQHIIDCEPRRGIVLSNLKFKDQSQGLINADSDVKIEYIVTKDELADALADYWNAQSRFGRWFS